MANSGIVLYDIRTTGLRYMSKEDVLMEARLLGLSSDSTFAELSVELVRRGLNDYSPGRVGKRASA